MGGLGPGRAGQERSETERTSAPNSASRRLTSCAMMCSSGRVQNCTATSMSSPPWPSPNCDEVGDHLLPLGRELLDAGQHRSSDLRRAHHDHQAAWRVGASADPVRQRLEHGERDEREHGGGDGAHPESDAGRKPHGRRGPQRRRRGDAPHGAGMFEDCAAADEPDPCGHVGGDTRHVDLDVRALLGDERIEAPDRHHSEQRGAERQQQMRAEPGVLARRLALQADERTEQRGQRQPSDHVVPNEPGFDLSDHEAPVPDAGRDQASSIDIGARFVQFSTDPVASAAIRSVRNCLTCRGAPSAPPRSVCAGVRRWRASTTAPCARPRA